MEIWLGLLCPLHPESRVAPVVPHQCHSDSIRQFAVNKVVREAFQVRAMKPRFDHVKSSGVGCGQGDHPLQLHLELFTQSLRHRVVTPQRLGHILLDGGMKLYCYRLRVASTRFQNSASESG